MHKGFTNLLLPGRNLAEYLTQPNLTFFLIHSVILGGESEIRAVATQAENQNKGTTVKRYAKLWPDMTIICLVIARKCQGGV